MRRSKADLDQEGHVLEGNPEPVPRHLVAAMLSSLQLEDEDVEDGCDESRNACRHDDLPGWLLAIEQETQRQADGAERDDAAADVLPANRDDGRVDIEAVRFGVADDQVPRDETEEVSDRHDREASALSAPGHKGGYYADDQG